MRLVVFDVDGTLVDSQAHIVASMTAAFEAVGLTPPSRDQQLAIVGLSLPYAVAELAPQADAATLAEMVETYKRTFHELRMAQGAAASPLFPGAREAILSFTADADVLLGIATGKSRRGLDALMSDWDFADHFVTDHCADDHPSKPHPAMVQACMIDAGVSAADTVVVGDTTFDMEMAKAARCAALGVGWGYHGPNALKEAGAVDVLEDFSQIDAALNAIWKG